jgi:hypothetical protein
MRKLIIVAAAAALVIGAAPAVAETTWWIEYAITGTCVQLDTMMPDGTLTDTGGSLMKTPHDFALTLQTQGSDNITITRPAPSVTVVAATHYGKRTLYQFFTDKGACEARIARMKAQQGEQ